MPELPENTTIVFVSDFYIGNDSGCDEFESPAELEDLFEELAAMEGPVGLERLTFLGRRPPRPGSNAAARLLASSDLPAWRSTY